MSKTNEKNDLCQGFNLKEFDNPFVELFKMANVVFSFFACFILMKYYLQKLAIFRPFRAR
ncbi:MAG: hypothetical protein DSY77_12915 [Bacteroidetes bacterium]|nr:MAG: hypothetical protein DSY77_12915 [Bacteroidota bacterium]